MEGGDADPVLHCGAGGGLSPAVEERKRVECHGHRFVPGLWRRPGQPVGPPGQQACDRLPGFLRRLAPLAGVQHCGQRHRCGRSAAAERDILGPAGGEGCEPVSMRHALIALAVFLFDRLSKWLVVRYIALDDVVPIIPGFFRLTHLENTGAAFSLFAESPSPFKTAILVTVSLTALVIVARLLWLRRKSFNSTTLALSLIMGGATGNLWDRLADGKVTDFLDFYVGAHHWPPFNVADSAIVVGALLLLTRTLHGGRTHAAE